MTVEAPVSAAGPSVVFGEGRRPESATRVQLEAFDGPLAMLLALIEARQLDVLTVPLGALADAYLDALAGLQTDRIANVSSFVAVASQLILIKSRAMLPRRSDPGAPGALPDDGPDPEAELRARLLLYRRYRDAGDRLGQRLAADMVLVHREAAIAQAAGRAGVDAAATDRLDPAVLRDALKMPLATTLPPPPPAGVMAREITLEERASVIRRALRRAPAFVLQDLLRDVRDRVVVAVTFLAMLELVKQREMTVEQDEPWGPIVCRALTAPAAG